MTIGFTQMALLMRHERKLPIEDDVYSDFYIKSGNVYIEFWGMESDENMLLMMESDKCRRHILITSLI